MAVNTYQVTLRVYDDYSKWNTKDILARNYNEATKKAKKRAEKLDGNWIVESVTEKKEEN